MVGPLLSIVLGIVVLLLLILRFKIPAFIALLIASIIAGLGAGLSGTEMIETIQKGMGSTLGFVAVVVGLGAMFGAILEASGGAKSIAKFLLNRMGTDRAPASLLLTGFIVAIPVFFDVAFIILVPIIYALQKKTGASLLRFAIPLLAGLAVTHAFIPPTPGPVAVCEIMGADLGWVILMGAIVGLPTAIISGLIFGRFIGNKIFITAPTLDSDLDDTALPPFGIILSIILVPILLILCNTFVTSGLIPLRSASVKEFIHFIGHPFAALIIANLLVWYILGINRGMSPKALFTITSQSLGPAGVIILLTGAGGVFKQVLVDTQVGEFLANTFVEMGFPFIILAFIAAAIVRVLQGSATVAMITAAGLLAPLITNANLSSAATAVLVIAISSGASIFSHVNDSGFWLVKEYLGLTEEQTFRSWTMMTTILALMGFSISLLLYLIV